MLNRFHAVFYRDFPMVVVQPCVHGYTHSTSIYLFRKQCNLKSCGDIFNRRKTRTIFKGEKLFTGNLCKKKTTLYTGDATEFAEYALFAFDAYTYFGIGARDFWPSCISYKKRKC